MAQYYQLVGQADQNIPTVTLDELRHIYPNLTCVDSGNTTVQYVINPEQAGQPTQQSQVLVSSEQQIVLNSSDNQQIVLDPSQITYQPTQYVIQEAKPPQESVSNAQVFYTTVDSMVKSTDIQQQIAHTTQAEPIVLNHQLQPRAQLITLQPRMIIQQPRPLQQINRQIVTQEPILSIERQPQLQVMRPQLTTTEPQSSQLILNTQRTPPQLLLNAHRPSQLILNSSRLQQPEEVQQLLTMARPISPQQPYRRQQAEVRRKQKQSVAIQQRLQQKEIIQTKQIQQQQQKALFQQKQQANQIQHKQVDANILHPSRTHHPRMQLHEQLQRQIQQSLLQKRIEHKMQCSVAQQQNNEQQAQPQNSVQQAQQQLQLNKTDGGTRGMGQYGSLGRTLTLEEYRQIKQAREAKLNASANKSEVSITPKQSSQRTSLANSNHQQVKHPNTPEVTIAQRSVLQNTTQPHMQRPVTPVLKSQPPQPQPTQNAIPNVSPQLSQQPPLPYREFPGSQTCPEADENCENKDFKESKRVLMALENGEQRLITFAMQKDKPCAVQDLLDSVGIPYTADTNIEIIPTSGINGIDYVVTVGNTQITDLEDLANFEAANQLKEPESTEKNVSAEPKEMSPEPEPEPEPEIPKFISGFLAVCSYCGFLSEDFNKCQRCKRKFAENPKSRPVNAQKEVQSKNKSPQKVQVTAKPAASGSPPKDKSRMALRKRPKLMDSEPVILTLSSDEEDNSQHSSSSSIANKISRLSESGVTVSKEPVIPTEREEAEYIAAKSGKTFLQPNSVKPKRQLSILQR